jgi:NAD(P)-dependent dehydrogenase (short-subunit alcohol dehydrogenase family)
MTEISGKVAFVTGGGSGIGRALATGLAAEGASVVVADIVSDNARAVTAEIEAAGGTAVAIDCDASDRASVRHAKASANSSLGRVSLLFANAGAAAIEPLTDMSDDDLDWILEVDLMGVVHCLRAFLPDMIAAGEGHVCATASIGGVLPAWLPYHTAYSTAKAGVIGMMLNLRYELAQAGVGCTVLCPGGTRTGMAENNSRYRPERFGGPGDGPVHVPDNAARVLADVAIAFRPAEEVAQMALLGVRNDRPMVVTEPSDRKTFQSTYVDLVMAAFDDVDAFERSHPRSESG